MAVIKGHLKKEASGECKWCEKGECWSHGQIEQPKKGKGKGKGSWGKGGGKGGGMWGMLQAMMGGGGDKGWGKGKKRDKKQVGDWFCPGCKDHQFAKNEVCRKCDTPKPAEGDAAIYKGKQGDWTCPGCQDHQYARNEKCRKCDHAKPDEGDDAFVKCRWCEQGECWDHGQIEKPARD